MTVNHIHSGNTVPWMQDEMALVNGVPCVYTQTEPGGPMTIRLPGGGAQTFTALLIARQHVVPPRFPRYCPPPKVGKTYSRAKAN